MTRAEEITGGLTAFLQAELVGATDIVVSDLSLISSIGNAREPWAFRVSWRDADGVFHTEQAVMLLKAEAGQLETALAPEFGTIGALEGSGVPVPRALWCDTSGRWLGQGFFITAFVAGTASMRPLRADAPDPAIRSIALDLARAAGRLHRFDWQHGGLDCLEPVAVETAARKQLTIWEEQFDRQRLEPHPMMAWAFEWLRRNAPSAQKISIVHGDLRFGNLLYEDGRLTALLDWEMTHLGDPVEDLGWVYRRLWSPERSLSFEEFITAYEEEVHWFVDREQLRWYQAFSEVKHGVISLTGARSFHDRLSLNLRHADRAETVPAFLQRFSELVTSC